MIAPEGSDGKVWFYNGAGGGVHVVADLSGYTLAGAEPQGTEQCGPGVSVVGDPSSRDSSPTVPHRSPCPG